MKPDALSHILVLLSQIKGMWPLMFSSPLLLGAIAIEGYAVLAVELLAIRQLSPYVGNATDTVAIVIAAVLLPLAFGYEAGGRASFAPGDETAVRRQLTRNLLIAAFILSFGLSHPFLAAFFQILDSLGLTHRLVQAAVQALLQKPVKPQDVVVVAPGKGLLIEPPAVDATEPRRRIQACLDVAFPEAS